MNKEDRVFGFAGGRNFKVEVYSDGKRSKDEIIKEVWSDIAPGAENAGYVAASSFLSTWKQDDFHVIYYDGSEETLQINLMHRESFVLQWRATSFGTALSRWITKRASAQILFYQSFKIY